jgi:hypothetical protein
MIGGLFPVLPAEAHKPGEPVEARPALGDQAVPPGSRMHAVKGDLRNARKVFAATGQGLEVSEDGGKSWQPLHIGGKHEEVFALAVHPVIPDTMLVGRRDGLWKSQDGGRSWQVLPHPESVPLSIAVAPQQPHTLYLATARRGIHKSTAEGHHWIEINKGLPEARAGGRPEEIRALAVDSSDSNVVYAALAGHGVYRTVDGGESWHAFNTGLPFPLVRHTHSPKFVADPDDPRRLYVIFDQRIHSALTRTRLYALSENKEWLPVEADLPANVSVEGLSVDRVRQTIQIWGSEAVWEVPLPGKSGAKP